MAASRINSPFNMFKRYKIFFYFCFAIVAVQLFLGYSFYNMNQDEIKRIEAWQNRIDKKLQLLTTANPPLLHKMPQDGNNVQAKETAVQEGNQQDKSGRVQGEVKDFIRNVKNTEESSLAYKCEIRSNEALSAISRAETDLCKQQLSNIACQSQEKKLIPARLPRFCPIKAAHKQGEYFGCYRDDRKDRDLVNFHVDYREDNTPEKCIDYCLRGSYLYAGVQYGYECWCGHSYGKHGTLPESSCKTICPGNRTETCGGYNAQRVFSTGLPVKKSKEAKLAYSKDEINGLKQIRIVFVLTVTGRAVRQIKRLLKTIYHRDHYYFIHVDSRQSYLYRELLKLEDILPNVRLARERMATIWGGASLLKAHFVFIKALLAMSDWSWDYYINLSESDYPIKNITSLTMFLQKHQGNTFLKSNGRETPTFIQKQGMDQTFYECDNHLWRLGKRDLPSGIRYDGGSDWICLDRKFCEYAVTGTDPLLTGLIKMYDYTLLPVESFFHVLLLNSQFCETWIDNNLHLTNWRRKQGCKCQYKHIVDWCGCSPNDMKQQDFDKVLRYTGKPTFFARKFEPIVSQEILNSVDSHLGITHTGMNYCSFVWPVTNGMWDTDTPALKYYWQNEFHSSDQLSSKYDVTTTFANSFVRRAVKLFSQARVECGFTNTKLTETHVLYVADSFYRYLVKFTTSLPASDTQYTLESQFSSVRHYRVINTEGIIGRLQSLEVGTDFDPKELIFRNYAGFMGPKSEVALRHVWGYGPEGVVTFAWIDPAGNVAAYEDVRIGKESLIERHNPRIRTPLRPGVWMIKVLHHLRLAVEVKFLVIPLATMGGVPISEEDARKLHNGPVGPYTQAGLNEFQEKLKISNPEELQAVSDGNGKKIGKDLLSWIDELTTKFWLTHDICSLENLGSKCSQMNLCSDTTWSSMSPDPKSEILGIDSKGNIR